MTTQKKYYQHEFESIEEYLHHRLPYLLVEKIHSINEKEITTEKVFSGDEYFAQGHFPGTSIFPGAMMQELTTQSAGILIAAKYNPMRDFNTADPFHNEYALGVLARVKKSRFKGFARPGDRLEVKVTLNEHLSDMFDFSATVSVNGKAIMRNSFQLINIKSTTLQGT